MPLKLTPAFTQWFGDSKVVDADGKPLVVYHGTKADFDEFKPSNWQAGYFFTTDPQYADERAVDDAEDAYANGENIVPVFLRARHLLDITKSLGVENEAALIQAGVDPQALDWIRTPEADQWMVFMKDLGGDAFVGACLRAGFDGVVFNEISSDDPMSAYAVFSPNQIKSAIGNSGDFDAANPDIRFSMPDVNEIEDDSENNAEAPCP